MQVSVALAGALVFAVWPALSQNAAAPPPAPASSKAAPAVPRPRMSAAAQRNENVAIQQIDNNAVKGANIRVGTRATVLQFNALDASYFAVEHGRAATEPMALPVVATRPGTSEPSVAVFRKL